MFEYEWSHIEQIATINSGDSISFTIFVERIEIDTITQEEIRTKLDVSYGHIINKETNLEDFPDTVNVSDDGVFINISGKVDADAVFVEKAYSVSGVSREVQTIEDIPFGGKVHKLIPSSDEYKYFKWKIFAGSIENDDYVEREFTLAVRVSWDAANKTIIKLASEIQ
jgi:hypothetical protein